MTITGDPMRLLADGIPLTLLLDLVDPAGPDSSAIYATEEPDEAGRRLLAGLHPSAA